MKKLFFFSALFFSFLFCSCDLEEVVTENTRVSVTSVSFESSSLFLARGEQKKAALVIKPSTAVPSAGVKYSVSGSSDQIVRIVSESSSGCVVEALSAGSCVISASVQGYTAYCDVTVSGSVKTDPYIVASSVAGEIKVGDRKTFSAVLYGGQESQSGLFNFESSDESVIKLDSASSSVIVTALKPGSSRITITHPDAKYPAYIMVYAVMPESHSVYINCETSILPVPLSEGTKNISVYLTGSMKNDLSAFTYEIEEGADVCDVIMNNGVFSFTPLREGTVLLKVMHPECELPFYARVFVIKDTSDPYITSSDNFILLSPSSAAEITCSVASCDDQMALYKFSYVQDNDEAFTVTQSNSSFYIEGKKTGKGKIIVRNEVCANPYEIMVIVDPKAFNDEVSYISTGQNVIKMEKGSEQTLKAVLAGGVLSDANNFTWTVSDSSVINLSPLNGSVSSRSASFDYVPGQALIEALSVGSCTIEITHPKSSYSCICNVRVYPEGSLDSSEVFLSGTGLLKVLTGKSETYNLVQESGKSVSSVTWTSDDESVVKVSGSRLSASVQGLSSGITKIKAVCQGMKNPHECTVISGTQEELDAARLLYCSNLYPVIYEGNESYFEIECSSVIDDELYEASSSDLSVCKARMSHNILILEGISSGKAEVTVKNENAENVLVLFVSVESSLSLDKPCEFSYEKFFGIVVGKTAEYSLTLEGGSERDRQNLEWNVLDPEVVSIVASGDKCIMKALKEGETYVTCRSAKSSLEARIYVYTVLTESELTSKVILTCDKTSYIALKGSDLFLKVNVNNPEINREKIEWSCDDINIASLDPDADSCFVRLMDSGHCTLKVTCGTASLKIFISVKEDASEISSCDISVPSVLELIAGTTKTITAAVSGMTEEEIQAVEWVSQDEDIVSLHSAGKTCYIVVKKAGFTQIKVRQKSLGIERSIQVVSALNAEDFEKSYVMGIEKTYYSLSQGDEIILKLDFGSACPSDAVVRNLVWTASMPCCEINPNGKECLVRAVSEGLCIINVSHPDFVNELEIRIACGPSDRLYSIEVQRMVGLVKGESFDLSAKLLDAYGNPLMNAGKDMTFTLSSPDSFSVLQAEDTFHIEALKKANAYLVIAHPLAPSVKVLLYSADTREELETLYPLAAQKDSFLLSVGDTASLVVITPDDSRIDEIKWNVSSASVCSYSFDSKKVCRIRAKKAGSCIFTASVSGSEVSFYVSVTEYSSLNASVSILTESIIPMIKGGIHETEIKTNLDEDRISSLVWKCSDESILSISGSGTKCRIEALKEGCAEVTVSLNSSIYRTVVVNVCDSESVLDLSCIMNVDERYRIVSTGSSFTVRPYSARKVQPSEGIRCEDVYQNNVVTYSVENGIIKIQALNEGIACLRVSGSEAANTFDLFVEVNPKAQAEVKETVSGYLTMSRTAYVMNPDDTLTPLKLTVIPVEMEKEKYSSIEWESSDESIISVSGRGETGYVYACSEGEASVRISSVYSSNILNIRIIVSSDETNLVSYLKTSVTSLELASGETKDVLLSLENVSSSVRPSFSASVSGNMIQASVSGSTVKIKGLYSGQGIVTFSSGIEGIDDVSIVVSVRGVASSLVYLTSSDTYAMMKKGEMKTLSVELKGYEEINFSSYKWEIVSQKADDGISEVIALSGTGPSRMCTASSSGTAVIKIVHESSSFENSALYPYYITVKVTEGEVSPVYISTESSVISLKSGEKKTMEVTLVNADDSESSLFSWNNHSPETLRIEGAGRQCLIKGLEEGIGRISVTHPSAAGQVMDIVVVVEKADEEDPLYITTDSSVIEMKPTDSYRQIYVTLSGGKPEQNLLFSWQVLSFDSAVKNQDGTSNEVISLIASQDSAIIKPKTEGSCIIRVTNSATSRYLDIKILVTLYSRLSFSSSSLSLSEYETKFVDVETPAGKSVIYESSNENVATVSGTSRKCIIEGTGQGTCVIRAHTTDGSSVDELIVKVEKNSEIISGYITSSMNVVSLNTLDDASGVNLKCELHGSNVQEGDEESFTWEITDDSIVSFAGASGKSEVTGNEVTLRPECQGETTVIISHEKAKNSKVIYVSVVQSSARLVLSSSYLSLKDNETRTVSAVLSGTAESEGDNIIWKSCNEDIACLIGSDSSGSVKGSSCTVRSVAPGECMISVTYGGIVKYVSVYVSENVSIAIPGGNARIAVNQKDVLFPVAVTPASYYDRVAVTSSSSLYAEVERYLDHDKKICYIKVSGTDIEGQTQITATLEDYTAKMNVTTSGEVYMKMKDLKIYNTDGSEEVLLNPSSVKASVSASKIRIHYTTEPAGIIPDNEATTYSMYSLGLPKFSSSTAPFVAVSYGKEDEGYEGPSPYYIDLLPLSAGYAVIQFSSSEHQGLSLDVPLCFTDDDFSPEFTLLSSGKNSSWDIKNGIINVAGNETLTIKLLPSSINSKMVYSFEGSSSSCGSMAFTPGVSCCYLQGDGIEGEGSIRMSTEYAGTLTVCVSYPRACGLTSVVKKTFIVNRETWK